MVLAEKLFNNTNKNLGNAWNFGPKKNSFINVYRLIIKISKLVKFKKISFKKNIYKETPVLKLNSQKSNKYLNWKQKWDIDTTILKILDWNEAFKNKKNIRKTCENQIKDYLN